MKKIGLFCVGGLSTTLLVNKMKKIANEQGYPLDISAYPTIEMDVKGKNCDLIILGPQAASALKDVERKYPDKKVMVCDMLAFSQIDAKKILEAAQALLESN